MREVADVTPRGRGGIEARAARTRSPSSAPDRRPPRRAGALNGGRERGPPARARRINPRQSAARRCRSAAGERSVRQVPARGSGERIEVQVAQRLPKGSSGGCARARSHEWPQQRPVALADEMDGATHQHATDRARSAQALRARADEAFEARPQADVWSSRLLCLHAHEVLERSGDRQLRSLGSSWRASRARPSARSLKRRYQTSQRSVTHLFGHMDRDRVVDYARQVLA